MAKNKRGRAYRLTPRRRAALHKAQIASARARRRRVVRVAGGVGATLAVAGGVYVARRQQQSLIKNKKLKVRQETRVYGPRRTRNRRAHLALPSGKSHITVLKMGDIGERKRGNTSKVTASTIFKVNKKGVTTITSKSRMKADTNRRRQYWQSKPVGGSARKPYKSNKRGLR